MKGRISVRLESSLDSSPRRDIEEGRAKTGTCGEKLPEAGRAVLEVDCVEVSKGVSVEGGVTGLNVKGVGVVEVFIDIETDVFDEEEDNCVVGEGEGEGCEGVVKNDRLIVGELDEVEEGVENGEALIAGGKKLGEGEVAV